MNKIVRINPWQELRRFTPARIALGRTGSSLPTDELLRLGLAHAQARDAVHVPLNVDTLEEGLQAALSPYRIGKRLYQRKLDGEQEAKLIALACSTPPDERGRWTLRLLAGRMVKLEHVDTLSHETVRQVLKKTRSSRTCGRCGASRPSCRRNSSTTWMTCWWSTAARTTPSGR